MSHNSSLRSITTSVLVGVAPLALLSASDFLWGFLFGGYNETFKISAFVFSIMTICGAPFFSGYLASRNSGRMQYMHALVSISIIFVAAKLLTSLVGTVGAALGLLASILPKPALFLIPDSVLLGNFDGTILLFILFCIFGAMGASASLKTCKTRESSCKSS